MARRSNRGRVGGSKVKIWLLGVGALLLSSGACSSSDDEAILKAKLSEGCLLNSDCSDPMVCAFRRCHNACESSRDCIAPQRCVASDKPFYVCQLEDEVRCSYNSECAGSQICGRDGKCRDQCTTARDCLEGEVCASGTCAEVAELVDGGLPPPEGGAPAESTGQPCSYNSDCEGDAICRAGVCAPECRGDKDCPFGTTCSARSRCEVGVAGSGGAGGNAGMGPGNGGAPSASGGTSLGGSGGAPGESGGAGGAAPLASGGSDGASASGGSGGASATGGSGGGPATGGAGGSGGAGSQEACPGAGWTRPCQLCADGPVGNQSCTNTGGGFFWGNCVGGVSSEVCDGKDNDCDGTPDNGSGFDCILGQTAACTPSLSCPQTMGSKSCVAVGSLCKFGPCGAGVEVCNGLDDNCSGSPDDGPGMQCVRGSTPASCTISRNNCSQPGIPSCSSDCKLQCAPATEVCDGLDNDCDGTVDFVQGGIECPKDTSEACQVQACNMTLSGTRACSQGCSWGPCIVSDACNDVDDSCDGRIDEGHKYVAGVSQVLLASTQSNQGIASVLDGNSLWVGWADNLLGSNKLRVGRFDVTTGAPLTLLADIGTDMRMLYAAPNVAAKVGSTAWFVSANTQLNKLFLVSAAGGSPTTAPTLTLFDPTASLTPTSQYYSVGGLTAAGSTLYMAYHTWTQHRVAAITTAGTVLWDVKISDAAFPPAALAFDGTNLHVAYCAQGPKKLVYARVSANGTVNIPAQQLPATECSTSSFREVFLEVANGSLVALTRSATFTAQFATLSLDGVVQQTQSVALPAQNALHFAMRPGTPPAFALGTEAGIRRYSQSGQLATSGGNEPPTLPTATQSASLHYWSGSGPLLGGPVAVAVNPTNSAQIVLTRLQCQ